MENKLSKREAIINAAIKVFSTKGYHSTRMEEIAILAEVGKGTIYEYFASKLDLFQKMLEESVKVYFTEVASLDDENLPFAEKLLLLLAGHIDFCKEHKELTRIVFWDTEIIDEELKEWSNQMRKEKENYMNEIIKTAINKGDIKPVNPRALTYIISGVLGSLWAPITLDNWEVNTGDLAKEITDVVMWGIGL